MISLDPRLGEIIDAYRTCEFVTLGRDGAPLAWPTAVGRRDDGTLLVTTSLAFARKALNVRRDGRVALLFSDPTASGLDRPDQVFVRGTAVCPEEIVTSPAGDEAYWSMLFDRQPESRRYVDAPARWLMDWYYLRLLITVTPTAVDTRPSLAEPAGTAAPATRAPAGAAPLGADVLAGFPTAVLAARDASGAPVLSRTRTVATADGFLVDPAPDCAVAAGPAGLLVHRHDDKLSGLYNALVRGELKPHGDGGMLLVPSRVVEPSGSGGPRDLVRTLRTARRDTAAYLKRRNLQRPDVDWPAFKKLAVASAGGAKQTVTG
ncbi:pyridoxamine 5'-phosphate oxidase family protein [Streptomyces sp. NPDC008150]|uniref:pyridoxamine 5'-phosphate oxidase family protein n=1 Tax=Streptomyces sp. NPDC008150 TaxID=3364816 RepID=UPI0036E683CF